MSCDLILGDEHYVPTAEVTRHIRQNHILAEVRQERNYQNEKWGGPAHDDTESEENWQGYITEYANARGRAADYDFRKRMVKVAALAVAAIESFDRKVKEE